MKPKKKPLRETLQVVANGTTYTVTLHGRSRKRVIVSYMYWDETGGLKGWEDYTMYDQTFPTEDEARSVFEYYQFPESLNVLRDKIESRWRRLNEV